MDSKVEDEWIGLHDFALWPGIPLFLSRLLRLLGLTTCVGMGSGFAKCWGRL